ncbi:hypothetical protein F5146DRAFT_64620 [Armillaria mellea]|nr:hypothetical protein F5146DRAFT_64620 [Armillaria mellea]
MPLLPNDYVTMFSILLAFLYLTVSTRAFEISVPWLVILNKPATAAWTRDERDQGDFVFLVRSLQSGESERLSDVPNNLSSGTISLNFTHPGCYEVGIGGLDTDHIAIRIDRNTRPQAFRKFTSSGHRSFIDHIKFGNWKLAVSCFFLLRLSHIGLKPELKHCDI